MYYSFFAFLVGAFFFTAPVVAWAQTPTCTIIYGGGKIECDATASATAKPQPKADRPLAETTPKPQQPTTGSGQTTTKGGLPVHEPTNAKTTPATGPEALALFTLLPAAAAGIWLRKKA